MGGDLWHGAGREGHPRSCMVPMQRKAATGLIMIGILALLCADMTRDDARNRQRGAKNQLGNRLSIRKWRPSQRRSSAPAIRHDAVTDPLIAHETQPTRTVAELARADDRLKTSFGSFNLPVLIMHGTEDKATRPSGSQFFFDHAGSGDKTLKLYDGHYHDLLNDLGKEEVLGDIRAWLEARV